MINKAVILAGGKGSRLGEYTKDIPKPLVKVNRIPIIAYIMHDLYNQGIDEFYILGGYKHNKLVEYFVGLCDNIDRCYFSYTPKCVDLVINHSIIGDKITVHIIFTGEDTGTAQRIKMLQKYIYDDTFLLTYGDTFGDVDIRDIESKLDKDTLISLCAIPHRCQYGLMTIEKDNVTKFEEKPMLSQYINGGYMCMRKEIFQIIPENAFDFSKDILANIGNIKASIHTGYWKAIDNEADLFEAEDDPKYCFV